MTIISLSNPPRAVPCPMSKFFEWWQDCHSQLLP